MSAPSSKGGARTHRYLGSIGAWALAFGYAVGWGAFIMPTRSFLPDAGPLGTLIGIAVGGAVMLIVAWNFHRMAVATPEAVGAYGYAKAAFGSDHGFLAAWFLCLAYMAIIWANEAALVFVARLLAGDALQWGFCYRLAGCDVWMGELPPAFAALAVTFFVCRRGRRAAAVQTALVAVMLSGVALCVGAAVLRHEGGLAAMVPAFSPSGAMPAVQVLRILAMIPWAYVGFEAISLYSAEFAFPHKRVFGILATSIVVAAAVYCALALLPVLALPAGCSSWTDWLGHDETTVFTVARDTFGSFGVASLAAAMLAAILTGLVAGTMAMSRLLRAMADDGMLPRWFSQTCSDGTPRNAVLFVVAASAIIPFFGRMAIKWPIDVSSIGAAAAYAYVSAAAFRLSRKSGDFLAAAAGLAGTAMSVVFCLVLLVPNYLSGRVLAPESYLLLSVWCIAAFLFYRSAFRRDDAHAYGRSTVVWMALLALIFFSSAMWIRESTSDAAHAALHDICDYHDEQIEKTASPEWKTNHMKAMNDYLARQIGVVKSTIQRNSLVHVALMALSLMMILSLYSVLRRRERALEEDKARAKSFFFSTVSHDIRTPLNAIVGFSQMLKLGLPTEAEREQAIDSIVVSGKTLLTLVNDILDLSKLEAGRMTIEPEPTDLGRLVGEIAASFRVTRASDKIEIRCAADGLPLLMVDPHRIRQIVFNLVGNAVKFTERGFIEIRARYEADPEKSGTGTLSIEVEDTGCGISAEDQKRIASPYVQVGAKTTRNGGTGLGLAICHQLAMAMEGTLSFSSEPGRGSVFAVTIPFVAIATNGAAAPEHVATPPATHAPAAAARLLVVDDSSVNLMVLKAMLKKIGVQDVVSAKTGTEAMAALKEAGPGRFDAVLTDIWMPEMDGTELVREIRADPAFASLPVYAVTADVELREKHEEAGFTGILLKPVTFEALRAIVSA